MSRLGSRQVRGGKRKRRERELLKLSVLLFLMNSFFYLQASPPFAERKTERDRDAENKNEDDTFEGVQRASYN
tara:strand:+ start:564 stop:782 length:219 start_codon:yes stop_codon:yes gene_type:complete